MSTCGRDCSAVGGSDPCSAPSCYQTMRTPDDLRRLKNLWVQCSTTKTNGARIYRCTRASDHTDDRHEFASG